MGWDWSIAANVAGVVGLSLAGYTFLSDRLKGRVAHVTLTFRRFETTGHRATTLTHSTVVLENHGPRHATGVRIALGDADGKPTSGVSIHMPDGNDDAPIDCLWPGQRFEAGVSIGLNSRFHSAKLTWEDGRFGTQERVYRVSFVHD